MLGVQGIHSGGMQVQEDPIDTQKLPVRPQIDIGCDPLWAFCEEDSEPESPSALYKTKQIEVKVKSRKQNEAELAATPSNYKMDLKEKDLHLSPSIRNYQIMQCKMSQPKKKVKRKDSWFE